MELIRTGKSLTAAVAYSLDWESYAAIDDLNRAFAGEEAQPSGIGLAIVDKEHNLATKGGYQPPFDFAKLYRQAWNVG